MSKREKTRQRGWIEFHGLRYAEEFMTRSELVREIHAFFKERGVNLAVRSKPLVITFSSKKNPRMMIDGRQASVAGVHTSVVLPVTEQLLLETISITVYVRKHATRAQFIETLFHELDHAVWVLQNKLFDHTQRYWVRPHEVRARLVGRYWSERLSR